MAVTLKELAAACAMSVSTVSKALNGYPDVSEATRQQVNDMATRLGYRPNAIARSLKMGRTYNIGVVYEDKTESGFTHNYFSPVLQAFKQQIETHGYDLTFITHRGGGSTQPMSYLEHCLARNVDGVCVVCCDDFNDPEILQLLSSGMPAVTIDHPYRNNLCVRSNNTSGMRELVAQIIRRGHRRIAYIHGEMDVVTQDRITAFREQLNEFNIPFVPELLVAGHYHNPPSTKQNTAMLLAMPQPPTCIIMPDDYASLGGMEAIREAGLRIPEDLSIAGFDGVQLMQMCSPKLTTFRQNVEQIGYEAGKRLIERIESPNTFVPEEIMISGSLVDGETVTTVK